MRLTRAIMMPHLEPADWQRELEHLDGRRSSRRGPSTFQATQTADLQTLGFGVFVTSAPSASPG